MSVYKFLVRETRRYNIEYTVEADSDDEAIDIAESGESLTETRRVLQSIVERHVHQMLSRDVQAEKGAA